MRKKEEKEEEEEEEEEECVWENLDVMWHQSANTDTKTKKQRMS